MAIKGVISSSGGKAPTSISSGAVSAAKAAVSPKSSPAPSYKQTSYISPTYTSIQSYNTPSYAPPAAPSAVPKATTISQQAVSAGQAQISQPKPAQIAPGIATISDIGAVGGQKKVSNSDGGYSLYTRSSEDTYNVTRYSKDGRLIESYSKKPGETIVTGVQPSSLSTPQTLSIKSVPSSSKIIEEIEGAAGGREGGSASPSGSSASPPEEESLLGSIVSAVTESDVYQEYGAPVVGKIASGYDYVKSLGEGESSDSDIVPSGSSKPVAPTKASPAPITETPVSATPAVVSPVPVSSPVVDESLLAPSAVSPTESTALSSAIFGSAAPTVDLAGIEGGKIYPVTDEEKAQAALNYLDKLHPENAGPGGDNELVCKYFWFMVPEMSQNGVDYGKLAKVARRYEDIINGKPGAVAESFGVVEKFDFGIDDSTTYKQLSEPLSKRVIRDFNELMIDSDIPPVVMGMFNAGLAEGTGSTSEKNNINTWGANGGLANDLKADSVWYLSSGAGDWLSSPQGMAAVGVGFNIAGAVGAFMAAGPIGAAAVMGTMPFSATELMQSFGEQAFKTKGELQLSGEYAQDHVSAYNTMFSTTSDNVKGIGMSKSMNDPTVNLQNIANAKQSLDDLALVLADKWQYFEAANVYDAKVRQYEILKKNYDTNVAMFDADGNYIAKDNPPINIDIINTDPTWKISYGELYGRGDGKLHLGEITKNFVGDIVITDENGTEIGRQQIKADLYGGDKEIDAASIVAQSQKYKSKASEGPKTFVRTIYLQPGQSMNVDGQTFTAKGQTVAYDVPLVEGIPKRITFSQAGKEDLVEYFGAQGVAWGAYSPQLKDSYVKSVNEVTNQGFKLATSPYSTVKINGKVYAAQGDKDTVPTAPGYYQVEVSTPGKETWQKTVYIGEGQYMAISDASQDIEEEKSYSSGGSGGGGGGGGSSGGSEDVTYAMIIYGETCRNARVWQDDTEIAPEIGKIYSISPGYHAIKIQKTGKKVWLKTVYCMAGDSVEVSPALEDETSTTTPTDTKPTDSTPTDTTPETVTKRVYFNSNPSSSRVMINGGFSGEWTPCFLDLEYGYYKIQILKTGYKPQDHTLYVGSVIAWDSYADQLANMEGIYYD